MATNTVQYPDGRQEIINVPKAFSPGDLVAITHNRDGGVVVQRVSHVQAPKTGTCVNYNFGGNIGGESYFKFWVKAGATYPSSQVTAVSVLRVGGGRVWEPTTISTTWTEITIGPFTDFPFDRVILSTTGSVKLYFDDLKFVWDGGEWDLNGHGGFEDGPSYWTFIDLAEITTTQYYEGSHSLMLL